MNREIKFRAWCPEPGDYDDSRKAKWKIYPVVTMDFRKDFFSEQSVEIFDGYNYFAIEFGGVKIMQYTGLKDKNGKEIYEGDIVKVTIQAFNGKYEMKWHDNGYWLDYKDNCWELPNEKYREVIGNIYENKDLLK